MKKVAFLDRDGTINVDHGWVSNKNKWEWMPRAIEGLMDLQKDHELVVVTNQGGIAIGKYTEQDVIDLHKWMQDEAAVFGIKFAAVLYCPHSRNQIDCGCRKPGVGMARQAEKILGEIDYANSVMIGDKMTDIAFGKTLGMKTILIQSKYWNGELGPDIIVDNLLEASLMISWANNENITQT